MTKEVFLYGKKDCCLCDDMKDQLQALLQEYNLICHVINIEGVPELEHQYGARIPVLVAENHVLCEGALDRSAIKLHFSPASSDV